MKAKKLVTALAMALAVFTVACKKDKYVETTAVCPMVLFTDPANGATNVPLNKVIRITFNEPMNPATINQSSFSLYGGGGPVSGVVTYDPTTYTMSFTPSSPLALKTSQATAINSIYQATVKASVKDQMGNALQTDYNWTFSTGSSLFPTVISTDPGTDGRGVPVNKTVTATFSEVMDGPSVIASYTLMQGATAVAGTASYAGTTASFDPSSDLVIGKTYTATITTGAKNSAGYAMQSNYSWSFTTGVDLKTVIRFGIISGTGVMNNAGPSVINNMDVGISPGVRSSITGFPPATIVNGAIYASDDVSPPGIAGMLTQAKQDLTDAYNYAEGATSPAPAIVSGDQGGLTLAPGIYKTASSLLIASGDLTLDAQGDTNAVWIFQIGSSFTTVGGAGGSVLLINGAKAKNIYWQVGSTATIGDFTSFQGNVLALTSITMNSGAIAVGRMLAINGAVTMTSTNTISKS